jgi:aminomethyltransferase
MGEFWIKGPNALPYLQSITSNDVSILSSGKAQYTCFLNDAGGIVDDLLIYCYEPDKYMLVVNASNTDKDWAYCMRHMIDGVVLENASERMAQLAVQGPKALETLQKLTAIDLSGIPYYHFTTAMLAGEENVIISNTGYTGTGGFELYFYPESAITIWNAVFSAGEEFGIKPVGLGARDTLRLEMGYCLYGNDLDDTTTPIEAGLGWITKFIPNKIFPGRDILIKQKEDGITRKLCGFELSEKGIPRSGYAILNRDGDVIGNVTSGTISPTYKKGIGLGYVKPEYTREGTTFYVKIREKNVDAVIVKLPFRK